MCGSFLISMVLATLFSLDIGVFVRGQNSRWPRSVRAESDESA